MDDQRIIGLIQAGKDHEAFKALYAYLPKVEHLVRQNSGRSGDAKDIFQDALIIFHRRVRSEDFTLTSSIGTFLFAVCRNLWRDELRRRNKSLGEWKLDTEADEPADLTSLLSREGANVSVSGRAGALAAPAPEPGPYGAEGHVYQGYAPLPDFGGRYPVIGAWIVGDQAAGMGIREDDTPITRNTSRFVPHYLD